MREVEATGKNIEQAIQNALLELKASREDVDIKILSEGGFLKKAKVKVSISEDAIEKYEKKEAFKKSIIDEEIERLKNTSVGTSEKHKKLKKKKKRSLKKKKLNKRKSEEILLRKNILQKNLLMVF